MSKDMSTSDRASVRLTLFRNVWDVWNIHNKSDKD